MWNHGGVGNVGGHKIEHQTAGHQPDFCICGGGDRSRDMKRLYWLIGEGCFLKKRMFFVACSHDQVFYDFN